MAKGIGSAGLPLGAMLYHEKYDTWGPGGHIGTFRGNVPAMCGGTRAIEYIRGRLREANYPGLAEVRGRGLFVGAEFVGDDGTPLKGVVEAIQTDSYERGVLVWTAGRQGSVLRLLPPLVMTETQAEVGLDIVVEAIER